MKSDFLLAITQLAAEKNLSRDKVLDALESALASAYKRDNFAANQNITVKINPESGKVEAWAEKTVTDTLADRRCEILLDEARKINKDVQVGDVLMVEDTPHDAGRIAAQTAKQVILQRLHEAEHSAIMEEYADKTGDVVTGLVQRMEAGQIYIDLGRTEAVLPVTEQVRTERYRMGQRLKVVLLTVMQTGKGPRVVVSRSHPDLLRRLFELEVPEVFNGTVEIKTISREAGNRSKVAVAARQEGIDPVGCCVGLRGIRIQNIVNELNNEKIDVVMWNPDASIFIANALSPAHIVNVELNKEEEVATVVVPDRQLSLAIGREGQNVRLAAKLSGWRIDIKSVSMVEAEKPTAEPLAEAVEEAVSEKEAAVVEEVPAEMVPDLESVLEPVGVLPGEKPEVVPVVEEEYVPPQAFFKPKVEEDKSLLRFAEDIMVARAPKTTSKSGNVKKKKKGGPAKEGASEGTRVRKKRQEPETNGEEDEEGY